MNEKVSNFGWGFFYAEKHKNNFKNFMKNNA